MHIVVTISDIYRVEVSLASFVFAESETQDNSVVWLTAAVIVLLMCFLLISSDSWRSG